MLSRVSLDYCLLLLGACQTGQSQADILQFYNATSVTDLLAAVERINEALDSPSIKHITTLDMGRYSYKVLSPLLNRYVRINRTKTGNNAILTDTINIKDKWEKPFKLIESMPFHSFEGTSTMVQMMRNYSSYMYYKDDNVEAVTLLFSSGAYIELVMGLPRSDEYIGSLQYKLCDLKLTVPKFTLHSDIDLKQILIDNGLGGLYDTSRSLSIIDATQKIDFVFDEIGARVAITTRLPFTNCSPKYNTVNFDRSFHFRMSMNDLILLSGYYSGT